MRKIGLLLLLLTFPAACSEVVVAPPAAEGEDDDAGSDPVDWTLGDGDGPGDAVVQISEPVDLTITPEGVIFLAGNISVAGQTDKVCSVERVTADGQYLGATSFETSPTGARLGSAAAVEVGPSGEVLLLCIGTKSGASDSAWVGWLTSDGALIAEAEVPDVLPYGLSITSDQARVVGRPRQPRPGRYRGWSRDRDPRRPRRLRGPSGFVHAVAARRHGAPLVAPLTRREGRRRMAACLPLQRGLLTTRSRMS